MRKREKRGDMWGGGWWWGGGTHYKNKCRVWLDGLLCGENQFAGQCGYHSAVSIWHLIDRKTQIQTTFKAFQTLWYLFYFIFLCLLGFVSVIAFRFQNLTSEAMPDDCRYPEARFCAKARKKKRKEKSSMKCHLKYYASHIKLFFSWRLKLVSSEH